MKFKFKTQPYQQDAVSNICRVFKGQPYHDMVKFTRDLGIKKKNDGLTQASLFDAFEENDDGYCFNFQGAHVLESGDYKEVNAIIKCKTFYIFNPELSEKITK